MLLLASLARSKIVAAATSAARTADAAAATNRLEQGRRCRSRRLLVLCVRVAEMVGAQVVEVRAVRRIRHTGMRIQHAAGVAARTEGAAARRWRHRRTVHVQAGILLLPFGAPVLEPDFHLRGD